jgi:hypothetical protein
MQLSRYLDGIGGLMDLATLAAALGGLLLGALAAALISARTWSGKLKAATQRVARLEEARKQSDQAAQQARKQVELLNMEVAELRLQAGRAERKRAAAEAAPAPETPDLLLRDGVPAEPFPATMLVPREPPAPPSTPAPGDPNFPATMIVPRKPR